MATGIRQMAPGIAFWGASSGRICAIIAGMYLRWFPSNCERSNPIDFRSEKNLAVAILRQAWHEAVLDLHSVKETSREDYRLLKKKAVEWINNDDEGFPYWCKLADVDHEAIRKQLQDILRHQHERRAG